MRPAKGGAMSEGVKTCSKLVEQSSAQSAQSAQSAHQGITAHRPVAPPLARTMVPALFTRKQIESRNTKDDAVIIIDNVVCDVTRFLLDHPGGIEVLLDNAGKDASKCFHDVGHSEYARDWMKTFAIGEVVEEDRREVIPWPPSVIDAEPEQWTLRGLADACGAPLLLAGFATLLYLYLFA